MCKRQLAHREGKAAMCFKLGPSLRLKQPCDQRWQGFLCFSPHATSASASHLTHAALRPSSQMWIQPREEGRTCYAAARRAHTILTPSHSMPPCILLNFPCCWPGVLDDLYSFNPATMVWTLLSPLAGADSVQRSSPSPRFWHGFTAAGTKLYVFGGRMDGTAGN
jgi:hypothetical protein